MYYHEIIDKMMPVIFILINNKTTEGYIDIFSYIKTYIYKLYKKRNIHINFLTFTTDFEKALFNAFNIIFNPNDKIIDVGCYFHYNLNIKKYLIKAGLSKNNNYHIYNFVMNIYKSLPFINIKACDIIEYI